MLFPGAKIVHAVRAPLDNCLAIYFLHLDQRRAWALELMDIGHYFREYHRLMTHWKTLCGDAIYDLNYGELVRAPDATPAGLGRFLGVELGSPSAAGATGARAIKTASARQARQPPCATSSGRAAHRARERNGLRAYLADVQPDTGPARHA